jgi:hypothetical protein
LRLRDSYDVPSEVALGSHSRAFGEFLWNWFGDTYRITRGELDLTFLRDLTPEELEQDHIIEGAADAGAGAGPEQETHDCVSGNAESKNG